MFILDGDRLLSQLGLEFSSPEAAGGDFGNEARALGTMTANTFIALVGAGVAVVAIGSARPLLREPVRRLRSRIA